MAARGALLLTALAASQLFVISLANIYLGRFRAKTALHAPVLPLLEEFRELRAKVKMWDLFKAHFEIRRVGRQRRERQVNKERAQAWAKLRPDAESDQAKWNDLLLSASEKTLRLDEAGLLDRKQHIAQAGITKAGAFAAAITAIATTVSYFH